MTSSPMEIDFPTMKNLVNIGMFSFYEDTTIYPFAKTLSTHSQFPIRYDIAFKDCVHVVQAYKAIPPKSVAKNIVERDIVWINTTEEDTWDLTATISALAAFQKFECLILTSDPKSFGTGRCNAETFSDVFKTLEMNPVVHSGIKVPEWFYFGKYPESKITGVGKTSTLSITVDCFDDEASSSKCKNPFAASAYM